MKPMNTQKMILIICTILFSLILSCRVLSQRDFYYNGYYHVQGFLDANNNGKWDEGESEFPGFTFEATLIADAWKLNGNASVYVPIGGVDFELAARKSAAKWMFNVDHKYNVTDFPEGYVVGEIIDNRYYKKVSGQEEYGDGYAVYKYEILVSFIGDPLPTPTPTFTLTPTATGTLTPTVTPIPTATFTPTPAISADLLGYGEAYDTSGYAADFVKFLIINKPARGTFSAVVNGKDYPCEFPNPVEDIIYCHGEPFPSGMYVDVVLYWEGIEIYSCQIFRAIPEEPTKTPMS